MSEKTKVPQVKVVQYADYLPQAQDMNRKGPKIDVWNKAVEMAFDANGGRDKFITAIVKGGETRFLFEV